MKKYTVSFIALLAVCFLFTSCIFDLFDSGDNDDDSSSTSAEQSASESQTAAEQYDANTFVQLENRSLYTVRVFRDSARGSAICTLKSGEKFVTGAKQTVEGTVYYLSYFVDVGMAVPWFDTNSVCYAAPKTGQTVSAFIYNPYSITTKNCYVVLENKSIETVVLKKGASELLPANDNPSVILPPEATGIYEIKTVDFANFAVFNICTAGGLMIAHLSSFISKLEANRIYNVEISLQGGHAVPELKTVMPFDSAVKSKDCVITYQSERGTAPEPKTFSVGNALTAEYLPSVKADGYVFAGWYIGNTKVDSTYFVQSDITLSAQWTLQTYSIKYVLDGGTNCSENPSTYTIKSDAIALKNPEKDECEFSGWYTTSDFSGDSISVIPTGTFGDSTFFAKWRVLPKYIATFNTNGGSAVAAVTRARVNESPKTTRTGYVLYDWYLDSNFSTRATFPYLLSKDTTFYAKWVECSDIAYRVEHLKQSENLSSYTLADSESLIGTTGSKTSASAKSYTGFHAKAFEQKEIEANGSTILKIYYDRNSYIINFNANGGTGSLATQTFYYGISQKLSVNAFKKSGYNFDGWAKSATGTAAYANTESILNLSESNGATVTLYAVWKEKEPVSYTVVHYKQTTALGDNYEVAETETLRGVPDFETSASAKSYTGFHAKAFEQKVIESNINNTVSIFYDRNNYTVKFNANGGIGSLSNQTFYYGVAQKLKTNTFKRVDNSFVGWAKSASGEFVYANEESVINLSNLNGGTVTLYAKWKKFVPTAENISELDLSILTEPYTVKIQGDITKDTILTLAEKIENATANITLDLSESGLTELKRFGNNGTYDSDFAKCNKLISVILPKNLEKLGYYTFYGCNSLEYVVLPSGLTTIGNCAFEGCENLISIDIPNTVNEIGYSAFYSCKKLTYVTIPNSVKKIGSNTFANCENLESVKLSNNLTKIESYCFWNCNLKSITIPDSVTEIESCAFGYCGLITSITIPANVIKIGRSAFQCNSLRSVIFKDTSTWYYSNSSEYKNGTQLDVSNQYDNATCLNDTYREKYWYKE